ncbi:MAG: BON domain-containing protein [Allosphingosinicella sp.]
MKTDSQLQQDVLDELNFEPQVDHERIGVIARNGVVTLTGFVPTFVQKAAAEKATRRVAGVKAIAEEIEVRFQSDPKTTDAEIAERILFMLEWDVSIPEDKLQVKVEHGWATLTGEVEWYYQKKAARKAAAKVPGVMGVTDLITLSLRASAHDVRQRIIDAFKRSGSIDANAIDVQVDGGTVRLGGKVRGWNERKVAERAALSTPGVSQVEDNIVLA